MYVNWIRLIFCVLLGNAIKCWYKRFSMFFSNIFNGFVQFMDHGNNNFLLALRKMGKGIIIAKYIYILALILGFFYFYYLFCFVFSIFLFITFIIIIFFSYYFI